MKELFAVTPAAFLVARARIHERMAFAAQIGHAEIMHFYPEAAAVGQSATAGVVRTNNCLVTPITAYAHLASRGVEQLAGTEGHAALP